MAGIKGRLSPLSKVPITVSPGSLQNYEPNHILWLPAPNLLGRELRHLTLYVTDQLGREIIMTDDFDVILTIKFDVS